MKYILFIIFILGLSGKTQAGFLLESSLGYESDALTTTATNSSTRTFYNFGFLFSLSKDVWGGWNYMGLSQSDTVSSTTTTYAPVDTGPSIKWQFGPGKMYNLGMTYNFVSTAAYSSGSTTETWSGTSYLIAFGLMPQIFDGLNIGVSINYYSASYSKKVVSNTESTCSNSKTLIFPTINITKAW